MSVAEWYLEVEGVKSGPYTPEQIAGLFHDGEILAHHRASSERLGGDSISVQELVTAYQKAVSEGFQPPPRPSEIDNSPTVIAPNPDGQQQDPTQNLFDALKAAKERQAAPPKSQTGIHTQGAARHKDRFQPQILLIIGLGIGFCLSVFALTRLLKQQTPPVTRTRPVASPTTRTPPPAPPIQNVPLNAPRQPVRTSPPRTLPRNVVPAPPPLPKPPTGGAIRRGDPEADSDPRDRAQDIRDSRDEADRERERERDREREREKDRERDRRDDPTFQELRDQDDPGADSSTQDEARRLGGSRRGGASRRELPSGGDLHEGDESNAIIPPASDPDFEGNIPEGNVPERVAPGGHTQ